MEIFNLPVKLLISKDILSIIAGPPELFYFHIMDAKISCRKQNCTETFKEVDCKAESGNAFTEFQLKASKFFNSTNTYFHINIIHAKKFLFQSKINFCLRLYAQMVQVYL